MPRILTLAALPLLAAAALTTGGAADSDSFLRTEPYELFTGASRDAWCEEGDAASALAEPADLRGAHFSFSLECLFKAPRVPENLASSIAALEHVPSAQDGAEFLFAQVGLPAEYNPEYTSHPAVVSSWIQIGEERIDFAIAPRAERFFVVAAPIDEPAVLWVEDSGRAQGVDLRTGEQVEPVAAYYNGLALRSFDFGGFDTEKVDVFNGRVSGWISCKTDYAEARRAVFLEEHGWAADGTVFLMVETSWCSRNDETTWALDMDRAFTIDGKGPESWTAAESASNANWDRLTMLFAIPADARNATIDFSPVGTIEITATSEELISDRLPNFAWEAAF